MSCDGRFTLAAAGLDDWRLGAVEPMATARGRVAANTPSRITSRTADDQTVPKPSPPFAGDFVIRSPNVAPKGRVNTNAIQNRATRLMSVTR